MPIKLNISGIRGKFSEFTPHWIAKLVSTFVAGSDHGPFLVGRDKRPSGPFIRHAALTGFLAMGGNVTDAGIMPTPILQWLIPHLGFGGGLSITAGHNPFEWNALIFLNQQGAYLNHFEGEEFFSLFHTGADHNKPFDCQGQLLETAPDITPYFESLKLEPVDAAPMQFVVDCVNGFSANYMTHLQTALDVRIIPLFCTPQEFSIQRNPEPTVTNAAFLATVIRETHSQGGFLLNSDASRVLIVDEQGAPYSEELTFPLFCRLMLEDTHSDLVTNYSTSKTIDRVAKQFSVLVHRTDVGQSEVVHRARELGCTLAGEGSGSTLYSPFSSGFDAFYLIRTVVGYLKKNRLQLSDLLADFSQKPIHKESILLEPGEIYNILERIGKLFPSSLRLKDGYYFEDENSWICVRASATVNMIRIIGEGHNLDKTLQQIKAMIRW